MPAKRQLPALLPTAITAQALVCASGEHRLPQMTYNIYSGGGGGGGSGRGRRRRWKGKGKGKEEGGQ